MKIREVISLVAVFSLEYWNIGMLEIIFFPFFHYSKVPDSKQPAPGRQKAFYGTI